VIKEKLTALVLFVRKLRSVHETILQSMLQYQKITLPIVSSPHKIYTTDSASER